MKHLVIIALFAAFSSQAQAEAVKLTGTQITDVLTDKSFYTENIEQIFQKSGQTVYIDRGNASQGSWFVKDDQYCSVWPPSQTAGCYDVTQDGDTVTFIAKSGNTYPMSLKK